MSPVSHIPNNWPLKDTGIFERVNDTIMKLNPSKLDPNKLNMFFPTENSATQFIFITAVEYILFNPSTELNTLIDCKVIQSGEECYVWTTLPKSYSELVGKVAAAFDVTLKSTGVLIANITHGDGQNANTQFPKADNVIVIEPTKKYTQEQMFAITEGIICFANVEQKLSVD